MSLLNWVVDILASRDVIDLDFICTDLKDVNITEHERAETAHYNSKCQHQVDQHGAQHYQDNTPIGKQVW